LSFNFTYSDIVNTEFLNKLELFFKKVPDSGSRVVFEITENESMESYDVVKEFINRFRKYGIRIAIDDFGSGFSNFNYILEMEPDYLKIDGSLIKDIDTNPKSLTMTEAIVNFSKKLGIKVIAEYVHSEKIFIMLRDIGVDEFQGFYFAQPTEAENIR
jgi:EAL domain-containing protein (putative c-di-GMP-specific phosphodiesterase class I)